MAAEKKIADVIYRFEPLTGWDALDALELLFKVAGPFVPVLEAVMSDNEEERTRAIVRVVPEILKSHDGASMRALAEALFSNCRADKEPVTVGVKPQSLAEMFQVFAFCLEKQFGDFFGDAGLGALLALLPSAKPGAKSL